jgi:uncharacterized membrane protein
LIFSTAEREAYDAAERAQRKAILKDKVVTFFAIVLSVSACKLYRCNTIVCMATSQKRRDEMDRIEKEKQAEIRSYKGLMVSEKMTSNKDIASKGKSLQELEEDFM